jgi:hypothetical protein
MRSALPIFSPISFAKKGKRRAISRWERPNATSGAVVFQGRNSLVDVFDADTHRPLVQGWSAAKVFCLVCFHSGDCFFEKHRGHEYQENRA